MLKKLFIITLSIFFSWNIIFSWSVSDLKFLSNSWAKYIWKIKDSEYKSYQSLSNFWKAFWNNNYRWAIPTPGTIKILKEKYWVKTIISLIPKSQIPIDLQKSIKDNWMERIVITLSKYAPKKADRKIILEKLKTWNAFIHCIHWADRTGAIVARAWIELEWKSKDEAYQDMLKYNPKVEKIQIYKNAFKYLKYFIYNWIK